MIKEGMNPLNMTISDLNDKIAEMKKEQGITSEEKFSTYLHKLEKEEGITRRRGRPISAFTDCFITWRNQTEQPWALSSRLTGR
jgi:hypothetical protein